MPWSAKSEQLLRDQYAAVGAAAHGSLPVAVEVLSRAAAGGLDVGQLLERTRTRTVNAAAFRDAYRRYCWPTEGLTVVRLAPFQVLASEGSVYHDRPQSWHLGVADRLVAADSDLVAPTRRMFVDTTDPGSVAAANDWWSELAAVGAKAWSSSRPRI